VVDRTKDLLASGAHDGTRFVKVCQENRDGVTVDFTDAAGGQLVGSEGKRNAELGDKNRFEAWCSPVVQGVTVCRDALIVRGVGEVMLEESFATRAESFFVASCSTRDPELATPSGDTRLSYGRTIWM
jgi:hypothetical protein